MKYSIIKAFPTWIEENAEQMDNFCSIPVFSYSALCVALLGLLGVVLNLFDIWKITSRPAVLNHFYGRGIISEEIKRNVKLFTHVSLVLNHFFLLLGLVTDIPFLFVPFLIGHSFVILLQSTVFTLRALYLRNMNLQVRSIIMSLAMVFNWSIVLCTFAQSLSSRH